ncbi:MULTISPECIES: hypothetical protein [Acetobacter]|uniref:hypothetical protein n=1 Tax=Acetobacter TaxID=434 RepID=UPI00376F4E2D
MSDRIRMDEKYQNLHQSPDAVACMLKDGIDPQAASMAQHQIALEAFMMLTADVLLCGDDVNKIRACVGNALRLACGSEFCEYFVMHERVLSAFPFLREGGAA